MHVPITCLAVSEPAPRIRLLTLDMPGRGANILDQTLFAELDQTLAELATGKDVDGLIVFSGKPSIFIAGADLNAISESLDWPDAEIIKFCERGRAVMARLSRMPFVTVAAIHGACVGGGLELALWCDCRVASSDRRTQLGLPEVKLGLVPGWAGTARLPRIIGFEPAAELLLSGRSVTSAEAHALGFVDLVCEQSELLNESIQLIRRVRTSESFIHHRRMIMKPVQQLNSQTALSIPETSLDVAPGEDDLKLPPAMIPVLRKLGEQILSQPEIYPFAPTVLLEHLARTAGVPQADAWKSESLAMAQVWGSPANRGLLNHFFLIDRNKKKPGLVDTTIRCEPVQTVAIVGAGLMGRAIAENGLRRGLNVLIYDADADRAHQVARELQAHTDQPSSKKLAGRVIAIYDWNDLAPAQWVIESVVETEAVKTSVLQKIESAVSQQTFIATNTSAIPISKLAKCLTHPNRFCGIHFCHPELMALVEIPCGEQTGEKTIAAAVSLVRQLGKMPVAMNDGPGFVVNRLLAAMINQAVELLLGGIPAEQIDEAMRDFGFLGGPFEIIDTIGVDTCMYAGRTMWESGLTCVTLSPILPKLMKLGRLGRKSGVGIYQYADGDSRTRGKVDPEFAKIIAPYLRQTIEKEFEAESIAKMIVMAMVSEGVKILDEDIVDDLRDIELCAIQGLSFPQHRGGIFFWADAAGLSENWLGENGLFYDNIEAKSV